MPLSPQERVEHWRRRTKQLMVEAMGGRCVCCGYDRCAPAIEFHHVDMTTKDFGFHLANPRKWDDLVAELRKCVAVCANCHREIHQGLRPVPEDAPGFNEAYATKPRDHEPKVRAAKTANKRFDWDSVDLLKMLDEHQNNVSALARTLNLSAPGVQKRLVKLRTA